MSTWSKSELDKIGAAEELEVASLRPDGTLRKPVPIWVVRRGDDLYVRSYRGQSGSWFRATRTRPEGHIRSGGVEKDVTFADANHNIDDEIDAAYRSKYHQYPTYVARW